jgi:arsenite methyltransferase
MSELAENDERIKKAVRDAYGDIARSFGQEPKASARLACCGPSQATIGIDELPVQSCCGTGSKDAEASDGAARFYPIDELAQLPDSVTDVSLGCGNPLAIAELAPGEVVLDLGSGGGIDCFLAAKKVGAAGRVIGLDMTPEMVKLARRNAKKMGVTNVDFRYGEMEEIPLPDRSVDAIISNCVINLSPDKDAVFGEAYRVLRPGGRLSVSDMVVDGDLPASIRNRLDVWAGCIAGALDERVYLDKMRAAGFEQVEVLSRDCWEIDPETGWDEVEVIAVGDDGDGAKKKLAEAGVSPRDLASKVASVKVRAVKPI